MNSSRLNRTLESKGHFVHFPMEVLERTAYVLSLCTPSVHAEKEAFEINQIIPKLGPNSAAQPVSWQQGQGEGSHSEQLVYLVSSIYRKPIEPDKFCERRNIAGSKPNCKNCEQWPKHK
jgi:hypothetical protein